MQVVLIQLQPFRRNSLLNCASQGEIAKNSLQTFTLGVQGRSRSSILIRLKTLSQMHVMISSKSVPIYNCFHAGRANSSKIWNF